MRESLSWLYVTGSPRSGTTLLQQTLNTHPEVLCLHEFDLTSHFEYVDALLSRGRERGEAKLISKPTGTVGELPVIADSTRASEVARNSAVAMATGTLMPAPREEHREGLHRAIFETIAGKTGLRYVGDKLPHNAGMPDWSRFQDQVSGYLKIWIVRRPDYVVASSLRRTKATQAGLDNWYIRGVHEAISEWQTAASAALNDYARLPERTLLLKYDDLCEDFASESARLAAFLGLENKFLRLGAPTPDSLLDAIPENDANHIADAFGSIIERWRTAPLDDLLQR